MAIKKDDELSTDTENVFRIDNGDLEGIKKVQEAWNLKDLESALIFAVGVLRTAEDTKKVLVELVGRDKPVSITPSERLLNPDKGASQNGEETATVS